MTPPGYDAIREQILGVARNSFLAGYRAGVPDASLLDAEQLAAAFVDTLRLSDPAPPTPTPTMVSSGPKLVS